MAEFYGYAERKAGSQVDWAGIGVDMSKTLLAEEKIREDKRVAIDDATNKTLEELSKVPKGEEPNGNRLVSDYSDNATKAMLMQHRLLKSGRLAPKDYMLFNANLKSGTNQMFSLQTEYQKQYSEKMARMKSGESQNAEADLMASYETFADLNKMRPVIDPKTGQVNLMIMEFDENNVLQPTGKLTSVQGAYKGMGQKFDRFKVAEASKLIADNLADVVMTSLKEGSLTKQGQLITLDYALQEPNTQKALDNYVDGYLELPYNVSSILTNDLGGYENVFTNDETKNSSGNKIVWNVNEYGTWTPKFTPDQKRAAKEYLMTQTKAQIAKKEEIKTFESAAVDAERIRLQQRESARQDKELKLRQSQTGTTEQSLFDEWANTINNKMNFVDSNNKEGIKENYSNPKNLIRQLNLNYGEYGYLFSNDGNNISIQKQGSGDKSVSVTIPMQQGALQSVKDYIIQDKAGKPKILQDYYEAGMIGNAPRQGSATKPKSGRAPIFKGLDANGMPILE